MTHLYNCRHDGDQFRITKFDTDMNVEASYLLTAHECECPAAARDTCRHRQMLPKFIARGAVDTEWFYDHDRGGWVQLAFEDHIVMEGEGEDLPELEVELDLPGAEPGGGREQASVPAKPMSDLARWDRIINRPHELKQDAEPSVAQLASIDRRGR